MEGKILAALRGPGPLDTVSLYAIKLAKRTGMAACFLLVSDAGEDGQADSALYDRARHIRKAGEEEGVKVEFLFTGGVFEKEVAGSLRELGSSILVVDEGASTTETREMFRRIEKELVGDGLGPSGLKQFLVVSKKEALTRQAV